MKISYKKLWKMLIDKNMNRKDLRRMTRISSTAIAKMGKCENVNTNILLRICAALKCDITEIMEIEYDESGVVQQEVMQNGQ
jgi:DNA-binding Xre family transcriptional regulator